MPAPKLSKKVKDQLVAGNHEAPRSVLGFHEHAEPSGAQLWIVRALEPDATAVWLEWEGAPRTEPAPLTRIHDGGLFELIARPRPTLAPYHLVVEYADGNRLRKHDPYFFEPQLG